MSEGKQRTLVDLVGQPRSIQRMKLTQVEARWTELERERDEALARLDSLRDAAPKFRIAAQALDSTPDGPSMTDQAWDALAADLVRLAQHIEHGGGAE